MTRLLYDEDAYLCEFEATVLSNENNEVILDKTAFFPEEGGQKCDTGTIGDARVLHVRIENGTVIHTVDRPVSGQVKCVIDWEPRFDKMQQHTGEHIVCGIVHHFFGYNNVGFHLADDTVTFDFDGPLTKEQLDEIEVCANGVVFENLPVKSYYPEDPGKLSYRSKLDLTENVRIVEIVGVDKCACCAPHVKNTGEVGMIKFTDAISYKGGVRISMACGMRALLDFCVKSENLSEISKALSAPVYRTAEYFKKYVKDTEELKQSISELKRELVQLKAERVAETDGDIIIFEKDLDGNMLRQYINALSGKCDGICAVFSGDDRNGYNFVASSDTADMRDIANELRRTLSAKCGGNGKMIQGSITVSKAEIENFFK